MNETSPSTVRGPTRFRKLRIAWSVLWGVATVLLIVLWVVSHGRLDVVCYQTAPQPTTPSAFHISALPHTFDLIPSLGKVLVRIPIWVLVILAATLAAIPSFHWPNRFSLRTLLIATTLVAVVLGLIVWAAKS
jgi:hypothetical protein